MRHTAYRRLIVVFLVGLASCAAPERSAEKFGKTYYLDGAGNWGFGASSVPAGLKSAGYRGDVEIYIWTMSLNPLLDQLNIFGAKLRAAALSRRIKAYRKRYPQNDLNMIALSAGTGVAVWAVEGLDENIRIHNLVLLGSSLSHDYDVTRALKNMTGNIYVYHSPHDLVLSGVPIIGTIDGKHGVASAGMVGLDTPAGMPGRVVNTCWSPRYIPYGWTGAHTDCTTQAFVARVIARHVLPARSEPQTAMAGRGRGGVGPAAHSRAAD